MSSYCSNLIQSSSDILLTLTEVTFRPHSTHCCSFTAVVNESCDEGGVSFSQLTRLIESIGHVGKIDDFTIKPLQQHSFLLTGSSRHTSSRLSSSETTVSTAVEAGPVHGNTTRNRPQEGRTVDARALASRSEPSSSDDACSSEAEQGRSSKSKHIPWSQLDEQRLLAYKKEEKSWEWIFGKFPSRTSLQCARAGT
jgi:hypothetical protein